MRETKGSRRRYANEKERRKLLLLKPEFINEVVKFREFFALPKSGVGLDEMERIKPYQQAEKEEVLDNLYNESDAMAKKYGISSELDLLHFRYFLITGDEDTFINNMFLPVFEPINHKDEINGELTSISLIITKATRLQDIKVLWPKVMDYQKKMLGNTKTKLVPYAQLDRDIEIYKLKLSGKTSKEIAMKHGKTYKDIDDIIRNLKARISKS